MGRKRKKGTNHPKSNKIPTSSTRKTPHPHEEDELLSDNESPPQQQQRATNQSTASRSTRRRAKKRLTYIPNTMTVKCTKSNLLDLHNTVHLQWVALCNISSIFFYYISISIANISLRLILK